MLRINAVKLEINTTAGLFDAELTFDKGLNIIRGNNSTGKSSMFQAILYGLGLEELLGRRNESTMQYVLKTNVNYNEEEYRVIQSFVYLEFTNGTETVTSKRSVASATIKPQLIEVIQGPFLTESGLYSSKPMWVHDSGGASNEDFGFHRFLQQFIGWNLPEVLNSRGELSNLFVQQIAPSFIIEQKKGWSQFLATIPYYNLRNAEGRSIEYLLNLDVAENEKIKRNLYIRKQLVKEKWEAHYTQAQHIANRGAAILQGMTNTPTIINDPNTISLRIIKNEIEYAIAEYVEIIRAEYSELEKQNYVIDNEVNERRLTEYTKEYSNLSLNMDLLLSDISIEKNQLEEYRSQLSLVQGDLRKNKDIKKINSLGGQVQIPTLENRCPLCSTDISIQSLLPTEMGVTPMQIEDNISYLEAQKSMIEIYIGGLSDKIKAQEYRYNTLDERCSEIKSLIRSLKKELISDDRIPSETDIEIKINLRHKIDLYQRLISEFEEMKAEIIAVSKEWERICIKEKDLPNDFYSKEDNRKLLSLDVYFKQLLNDFNYSSQTSDRIVISKERYLPMIESDDNNIKLYDISYYSSGSDFIRSIWAYSCALLKVSDRYNTNHPRLLMLDEPQQQSASNEDFRTRISELSNYTNDQILVFSSFNNSESDYKAATENISFSLNYIEEKIVKPSLDNNYFN